MTLLLVFSADLVVHVVLFVDNRINLGAIHSLFLGLIPYFIYWAHAGTACL